ncbi:hypothetical protein [Bifidobacterium avesanii]|uniref:Uncharacterized protein n=1 Tax=Bifidobacterium avesanii TaxID=1798157 RepID=A0A7K3TH77_9BIFI|nr:hypothetical protein [Bifidobacterium avesanii]KAB8295599.1 hypothetical protein DSM100685_0209 [Bifidobacterium avesanii]NEG77603.1 hypothetical protein [Bifidobacterium avesanii]
MARHTVPIGTKTERAGARRGNTGSICAWELRNVVRLPALWGFLALCLLLNSWMIVGTGISAGWRDDLAYAARTAANAGTTVDERFVAALAAQPASDERDALLRYVQSGFGPGYEGYDAIAAGDWYAAVLDAQGHPHLALQMRLKAQWLQSRAEHLAATGASDDFAAGSLTTLLHSVAATVVQATMVEGMILGPIIMLYAVGGDRFHRLDPLVNASRTGRRTMNRKLAVGVCCSTAAYLVIAAAVPLVFALVFRIPGLWSSSVSSRMLGVSTDVGLQPFLTWADFSMGGYLCASLGLGLLFTLAFTLFAGALGMLLRNVLAAFGVVMAFGVAGLVAMMFIHDALAYQLLGIQPMYALANASQWFTDMGTHAMLPWQETVVTLISVGYFAVALIVARRAYSGKDLT